MALTTEDLARIDAAIASGELEVEIDGNRVRYPSAADLLQRRAFVAAQLSAQATAAATGGAKRATYYHTFTLSRER